MTQADMVLCPECKKLVALTPARHQLKRHDGGSGSRCIGSGHRPDVRRDSWRASGRRTARIVYGLVFTGIAGVVGILGWLGIQPGREGSNSASGDRAIVAPDPYQYISFDDHTPPKAQECVGLLGLCLGQSRNLAFQQFGQTETEGMPRRDLTSPSVLCHGWRPARLQQVIICEENEEIVSFEIWLVPGPSNARMSLPEGVQVTLPSTLPEVAQSITRGMGRGPFDMTKLDGEGYWIDWFSWRYVSMEEGVPYASIQIGGRQNWTTDNMNHKPKLCDSEAFLGDFRGVTVEKITVRNWNSQDDKISPCRDS